MKHQIPSVITEDQRSRFMAKVEKTDTCWLWTASKNHRGYGRFAFYKVPFAAHRVSYHMHIGPIPDGMFVCHRCDNPKCVRPDHLFIGTARDNTDDMINKGRVKAQFNPLPTPSETPWMPRGEAVNHAKLNPEKVREIRKMFSAHPVSAVTLGKMFGVGRTAIRHILTGVTWRHVA